MIYVLIIVNLCIDLKYWVFKMCSVFGFKTFNFGLLVKMAM